MCRDAFVLSQEAVEYLGKYGSGAASFDSRKSLLVAVCRASQEAQRRNH